MKKEHLPAEASALPPTPPAGLSFQEAERRRQAGLSNHCSQEPGKSVLQIIAENLFTPFNLLNFALAFCLVLVNSWRNMLFLGVVFSNTLIGTVQELRARATIHRLQLLTAPHGHALRDGQEVTLRPEELVLGDLVILRAGDEILADARVLSGKGAADESLLTGESDPVEKAEGDTLLSGSHITEGCFTAQLTRVGDESYAARLTSSAKKIKRPKSALMTDLNKLVKGVSIALVPIGLLLMAKQYFLLHIQPHEAVPTVVAAMIGMIPEGLLLLTSMALAVGVVRLGRRQTLVQELYGIETLARADVLCLDKTGTITTGDMRVEALIPLDADEKTLTAAFSRFLGAFEPVSPTLKALAERVTPGGETPADVVPFSSSRKRSEAQFSDGVRLMLGAPGFLPVAMPESLQGRLTAEAALGRRVLVLAEQRPGETPHILGLASLSDRLRPNVHETLRYFREQGVDVRIISGDDPRTVSVIAQRAGLENAGQWVDASALTTPEALEEAVQSASIFGRVTPEQKKELVYALKHAGHSVAMIGDGVNDIPALKAADCSIAMGSGSDAARRVAQVTLISGDFASLPAVVAEGRRVVGNVQRTATLFLTKTLYSFILALLTLAFPVRYPFQPIHLTLISSLTIGIPGFFLALEPNNKRITGSFLRAVISRAAPGAAAVALCALNAMLMEGSGIAHVHCATIAALTAGVIGLMQLARVAWPLSRLRMAVIAGMSLSFAAAVIFLDKVFYLTVRTMPSPLWGDAAVILAVGVAVLFAGANLIWYVNKKRQEKNGNR